LLEEWNGYMKAVFPDGRPDAIQLQETRRAFYAGAHAILSRILGDLTGGTEAEEQDLTMMNDFENELRSFNEDVKAGRA
jgi:hypothetical protein